MRIERIEFEAIGPFAGYYDIDLNQLGDAALFLIDGPTGAGKSTILDAITFAIYGDTSGTESDKSRMRSQYAKATQESWVRVTFSTPNGTYRIRRSPDFQKEKLRGEGTTKVNGTAQFQRLDGSNKWLTEFEQIKDSSEAALQAVGLTKSQFAQTVLLPQGEFDKFLKSDSKERQDLLSRIFNTSRFTKLRESLKARAKKVDSDLADLNNKVAQRASTIDGIFEFFEDDAELLQELAIDISKVEELFAFLDDYEKAVKVNSVNVKASLKIAAADLEKASADLELRNRELAAKTSLDNATEEAKESKETLAESMKAATTLAKAQKFELVTGETWQVRSNRISAGAALLENLVELESALDDRQQDADDLSEELEQDKKNLEAYEKLAKSLPADKNKLEAEKAQLKPLAAKVAKVQAEVAALAETGDAIEALHKLKTELPDETIKATAAAQKAAAAEDRRHKLVAARLANMAGELASVLEDGKPCEVCGSLEHPKPKKLSKDSATPEEIEKAEEDAKKLKTKADEAQNRLTQLNAQIDAATKNLKVSPAEFEVKLAKATVELTKAEEAADRFEEIEEEIIEINKLIDSNQDQKASLAIEVTRQVTELAALLKSLDADKKEVASKALPYKTAAEKAEATGELDRAISSVLEAEGEAKTRQAAIKERETDLKKFEKHPDFAKPEKAQVLVDLAKPKYEGLLTEDAGIEDALKKFKPAYKELKEVVADRSKLLKGSETIKNLSRIADGDNPFRQPIDTFVLQSMFRQVLAAGNNRFQSLLEGRYTFELDEIGSDKRSAQGLGLSVRDRNTGETRTTKSLSGGEAFCASLSLALGLSDIVRADSGGLAIDTFFIDEGFGSLDGERLNQVNNMLSRLQAEGRTIGLISHVAEMKDTIQEKVDVKPSKDNGPSTLTVNWAS